MRILLTASACDSMTQRVYVELTDRGHAVSLELALSDETLREGVRMWDPELIIALMLTSAIPEDIWHGRPCFIVHPGPMGDRGPSSLDWALMEGARTWGVTVLQAAADMDAGDIWASETFPLPSGVSKSSLYRHEVADAAARAVLTAVARFASGIFRPRPLVYGSADVLGRPRPPSRQEDRAIDWLADSAARVAAKLRAADSSPGVRGRIAGREYLLYGGYEEDQLCGGPPGSIIAQRDGAICLAASDGAVWVPRLKQRKTPGGVAFLKLPATLALRGTAALGDIPVSTLPLTDPGVRTYQEISYRERGGVGYVQFAFPGGAMSTSQCRRLHTAYMFATARHTRAIVIGPPRDIFSNGVHLSVIEAAADPAQESWENINAIDDLVLAIVRTTDRLTVASVVGNAAAGGLMMALAADEVWCRQGSVLNPHYGLIGLHGSEYWTYLLPRRVGAEEAARLTTACRPSSAAAALRLGLVDRVIDSDSPAAHQEQVMAMADQLIRSPDYALRVAAKKARLLSDQAVRPLADYRRAELEVMWRNFAGGPGEQYPALRRAFVRKDKPGRTPPQLALHRAAIPV